MYLIYTLYNIYNVYICECVPVSHIYVYYLCIIHIICDPMDCGLPGSSVHGDSPGKNTGVVCHALLQGIFPTQGSNPGLPHCRQILHHLSHQGHSLNNCSFKYIFISSDVKLHQGKLYFSPPLSVFLKLDV